MTSTNELFWIRGTLVPKLFRRWARERSIFRDKHLDAGYAAHCLFTGKFGDSSLKPYHLSTMVIPKRQLFEHSFDIPARKTRRQLSILST